MHTKIFEIRTMYPNQQAAPIMTRFIDNDKKLWVLLNTGQIINREPDKAKGEEQHQTITPNQQATVFNPASKSNEIYKCLSYHLYEGDLTDAQRNHNARTINVIEYVRNYPTVSELDRNGVNKNLNCKSAFYIFIDKEQMDINEAETSLEEEKALSVLNKAYNKSKWDLFDIAYAMGINPRDFSIHKVHGLIKKYMLDGISGNKAASLSNFFSIMNAPDREVSILIQKGLTIQDQNGVPLIVQNGNFYTIANGEAHSGIEELTAYLKSSPQQKSWLKAQINRVEKRDEAKVELTETTQTTTLNLGVEYDEEWQELEKSLKYKLRGMANTKDPEKLQQKKEDLAKEIEMTTKYGEKAREIIFA